METSPNIQHLIAVKVGSNVLTRSDGSLDVTRMSALVDQIAELRKSGFSVVLISSGAVASGRSELRLAAGHSMDRVDERQLYSAVGQAKLINRYYELFREYGIPVGQILTTKESFGTRRHYLTQRNSIAVMLQHGVLPIVNENDTVSVTELMFTDNDELSGLIACMMRASTLIILSNVDGIFDGPPGSPGAAVIREVDFERDLSACIRAEKSDFGRGGMMTKCHIARRVAHEGVEVIIANGKREQILCDLVHHPERVVFTRFRPQKGVASGMEQWLPPSLSLAKGQLELSHRSAVELGGEQAQCLYPKAVSRVIGSFERDDIVRLITPEGQDIGVGRIAYSSEETRRMISTASTEPLIHYDHLYLE